MALGTGSSRRVAWGFALDPSTSLIIIASIIPIFGGDKAGIAGGEK